MYKITFSPEAETDLGKLKRSEPASFKKAVKLLNELVEHPKTGTGHPEPLKALEPTDFQKASACLPYFRDRSLCGYPLRLWSLRG